MKFEEKIVFVGAELGRSNRGSIGERLNLDEDSEEEEENTREGYKDEGNQYESHNSERWRLAKEMSRSNEDPKRKIIKQKEKKMRESIKKFEEGVQKAIKLHSKLRKRELSEKEKEIIREDEIEKIQSVMTPAEYKELIDIEKDYNLVGGAEYAGGYGYGGKGVAYAGINSSKERQYHQQWNYETQSYDYFDRDENRLDSGTY